jgi:hypothetical protein
MVEQLLEGDNVADLISSQPCGQGLVLDLASSFNFSSFPSLLKVVWFSGYPLDDRDIHFSSAYPIFGLVDRGDMGSHF